MSPLRRAVYDEKNSIGEYELPGLVMRVFREGEKFMTQVTGQEKVEIVAESETTFSAEGTPHPRTGDSRRNFLWQLSALCISVIIRPKFVAAIETDPDTRIAAQWRRIKGGLPASRMATCERIAAKLAPRSAVLLKDSEWEGRTYKAIVDELRAAGIYSEYKKTDTSRDADRLRGEARKRSSSSGAVSASIGVAQAAVATLPIVGPVIAAALLLIAAVILLIAQIVGREDSDEPSAKERQAKKDRLEKIRAMELRLVKVMESLDDCILFKKKDDC
jgi:hypothetical protein